MELLASLTRFHPISPPWSSHPYRLSVLGDLEPLRDLAKTRFPIAVHQEKNLYRLGDKVLPLISPCLLDFAREIYVIGISSFDEIIYSLPVESLPPLTYNVGPNPVPHYGREMTRALKSPGWIQVSSGQPAFFNNRNSARVVQYLDGMDQITLKANLVKHSGFVIPTKVLTRDEIGEMNIDSAEISNHWFIKPSHPYIGSGRFIMYGQMKDLKSPYRKRPRSVEVGKKAFPIDTWVLQPEILPMLWGGRKWDARFYAVAIYRDKHLLAVSFDKGFARSSVEPYQTGIGITTITNISVQETIPGYNPRTFQFPLDDQAATFNAVVADCFNRNRHNFIAEAGDAGVIILGFDMIYSASGRPYLIEVNHEPALDPDVDTVEGQCARIVWETLSTTLLPLLSSPERFRIAATLPVQMVLPSAHIAAQISIP